MATLYHNSSKPIESRNSPFNNILEIIEQMGDQLDAFIAGIGTGGTITGAGEVLKEAYKDIKIYAVEPADSPVLSGGKPVHIKSKELGDLFRRRWM